MAAREKALQDPKLQQLRQTAETAKRDFLKAMRDKMLEIDPGLADIVKKWVSERKSWKGRKHEGSSSVFGNLSARQKAKSDPAVQAAEKKKREANTLEEQNAASEDYRKAMREAMLKADASIAALLEKMAPKPPPSPNPANAGAN
jgi:ATPase subunit of ABC transporter with duplicated ATPase domains